MVSIANRAPILWEKEILLSQLVTCIMDQRSVGRHLAWSRNGLCGDEANLGVRVRARPYKFPNGLASTLREARPRVPCGGPGRSVAQPIEADAPNAVFENHNVWPVVVVFDDWSVH